MEVVYRVYPEHVSEVLDLLRQSHCNPVALDNPDSVNLYASKGTYQIRIAVDPQQVERATAILNEWEKSRREKVGIHSRTLGRDLLISVLVTLLLGACGFLMGVLSLENITWLPLVWLASFVLISNSKSLWEKWQNYSHRHDKPLFPGK